MRKLNRKIFVLPAMCAMTLAVAVGTQSSLPVARSAESVAPTAMAFA